MRIAVFYNLFFSGAKRTVFEHVKGLIALGHIVDVYTLEHPSDIFDPESVATKHFIYKYNQRSIPFPFLRKITKDLSDFHLLKKLHSTIARGIDAAKYDIALIHTDQYTQAPFILRYLKTKNVYFCLEPLKIAYEYGMRVPDDFSFLNKAYEIWNRKMRKEIDRQNARAANETLAISYFGRELMIQAFDLYPKVSYLGVDTKLFKNQKIRKKNQILFIGQKLRMNGYDFALEAIDLIPKNIRPELKVLSISKNKKERVTDQEIAKMYNESLLTLSLSNFDTFGLVPLESLACEVPVIAFNVAGYRETLIDGKTGFLVDFSSQAIADRIAYLIKNPEVRNKMGKVGREWVEKEWTWSNQIKKLEEMLKFSSKS